MKFEGEVRFHACERVEEANKKLAGAVWLFTSLYTGRGSEKRRTKTR